MTEFTKEQLDEIRGFLGQVRERANIPNDEWWACWESGPNGADKWRAIGMRDGDTITALWWYRCRHKPRSTEWRPVIILRALLKASQREYVEPGQMEPNDAALNASHKQKKQARMLFIRRFGFDTFREKVGPILRRHGVRNLFNAPATSEVREYVAILAGLAK